jgi:transcriptional regulator GlxA family with amidase domain
VNSHASWLDAQEWNDLGASEAHLYYELARACGLNPEGKRDGRILDRVYKLVVQGYAPEQLSKQPRVQTLSAANQRRREIGAVTRAAVKRAYVNLSALGASTPPTVKELARHMQLSVRQIARALSQLRSAGEIRKRRSFFPADVPPRITILSTAKSAIL